LSTYIERSKVLTIVRDRLYVELNQQQQQQDEEVGRQKDWLSMLARKLSALDTHAIGKLPSLITTWT